jgi:hypothetical protein
MASLSVLFERSVDGRLLWEALSGAAALDVRASDAATPRPLAFAEAGGRPVELSVDGCPIALSIHAARRGDPERGVALAEAARHSHSPEAARIAEAHAAEVLLEAGTGAGLPPLQRLEALTRVAAALLPLPGAVALYDEAGRALNPAPDVIRLLGQRRPGADIPPLDLWIALRRFQLADAAGWFLDTLGMAQLGLPDLEAYAAEGPGAAEVAAWLRNLALYLVQQSATGGAAPLGPGDTLDGPDETPWVTIADGATAPPQRLVLRFAPA